MKAPLFSATLIAATATALFAAAAPLETRPPVGQGQPAFPGQTRAPAVVTNQKIAVDHVVAGLSHPWGMAFLPDGRLLVTERAGRLRILGRDGVLSAPVAGLPAVEAKSQGGLLDVALDPKFKKTGLVYWTYAETREGGNGTAIARGRLVDGPAPRLEDVKVIFRMEPTFDSGGHFGSRLAFARDGSLFVTFGERFFPASRVRAQTLDNDFGKVIRIRSDGAIPADNPFVKTPGARGEIWSYGHRNPQGAAIHPRTGRLWVSEHGPKGGDEINVARPGANYGWPVITYGRDYDNAVIGEGVTAKPGMEQPVYYWDPVIAASGMTFYEGAAFPAWRGDLLVAGLGGRQISRLKLDGERVVGEERLLADLGKRIRDVAVGPDGFVYALTDEEDGEVLRLRPAT